MNRSDLTHALKLQESQYYKKAIGSRIQMARLHAKLSPQQLGERLGYHRTTSGMEAVRRWEKGVCCPRLWQLIDIAHALGVEPYDLLPEHFTAPDRPQTQWNSLKK